MLFMRQDTSVRGKSRVESRLPQKESLQTLRCNRVDAMKYLARNSHTQPAAAAPSSGLAVLRFLGLLDVLQRVRLRGPRSQALPGRRLSRLAATRREKCGLAVGGLLMLIVFQLACGYRVASKNRLGPDIQKISVLPLKNETTTFEVEQILTRSLVRAFVERSSFTLVNDPADADAVLTGVVSALNANPVVFGQETFGSTFLVTLNARVELRDRKTGKALFKNNNYVFREQYVINVDVKNFFSELNPALGRIAEDFSSSIVSTILEGY